MSALNNFLVSTANVAIERACDKGVTPRIIADRQEFTDLLNRLGGRGMQPLCLIYASTPSNMLKTGNPYNPENILKVQLTSGQVNRVYEDAVNLQREKEGKTPDMVAKPNSLVPVFTDDGKATPFVRKVSTGELQLRTYNANSSDVGYFDRFSGESIPYESIARFIPLGRKSGTQGLDKDIRVNNWILDKVAMIRAGGECLLYLGK